jgi:hypothetical protein
MATRKRSPRRRPPGPRPAKGGGRRWSRRATEESHALALEDRVFSRPPTEIARSLKRSAERSKARKSSPFRSAMSMLTFYQNRAGKKLPESRKRAIRSAKAELRRLFGRPARR